jgi:hypothetical protein
LFPTARSSTASSPPRVFVIFNMHAGTCTRRPSSVRGGGALIYTAHRSAACSHHASRRAMAHTRAGYAALEELALAYFGMYLRCMPPIVFIIILMRMQVSMRCTCNSSSSQACVACLSCLSESSLPRAHSALHSYAFLLKTHFKTCVQVWLCTRRFACFDGCQWCALRCIARSATLRRLPSRLLFTSAYLPYYRHKLFINRNVDPA